MFNIIKGSVINKNVKPVVINPNKKKSEEILHKVEEEHLDAPLTQEKTILDERDLYNEYFDDAKARLEEELKLLEETIKEKKNILENLGSEVNEVINKANFEAEDIINNAKLQAKEEVNDLKAEAWEQGFYEGKNVGKDEIMSQVEQIYTSANNLIEEASKRRKELLSEGKDEIIKLAFAIAEKVIKKEVESKEVLINNIIEAMKKAPKSNSVKLFINYEQFFLADELREKIGKAFGAMEIEVVEDYSLMPGGAIIETRLGRIDASIESQLDALYDALGEV